MFFFVFQKTNPETGTTTLKVGTEVSHQMPNKPTVLVKFQLELMPAHVPTTHSVDKSKKLDSQLTTCCLLPLPT